MKSGQLVYIGAAAMAAWALWTLYQRINASAPAPTVGVGVPALGVPPAALAGTLTGDTWASVGADLGRVGFNLPDPWASP